MSIYEAHTGNARGISGANTEHLILVGPLKTLQQQHEKSMSHSTAQHSRAQHSATLHTAADSMATYWYIDDAMCLSASTNIIYSGGPSCHRRRRAYLLLLLLMIQLLLDLSCSSFGAFLSDTGDHVDAGV